MESDWPNLLSIAFKGASGPPMTSHSSSTNFLLKLFRQVFLDPPPPLSNFQKATTAMSSSSFFFFLSRSFGECCRQNQYILVIRLCHVKTRSCCEAFQSTHCQSKVGTAPNGCHSRAVKESCMCEFFHHILTLYNSECRLGLLNYYSSTFIFDKLGMTVENFLSISFRLSSYFPSIWNQ